MEHSGQWGVIDGVAALRNWSIEEGYSDVASVHSGTKHGTNRNRGIYDWTGSYGAYGAVPFKMPGEYIELEAYKAPTAAGDPATGEVFKGDAYVISAAITWNFTTNEIISHVVNFGGHGDLEIDTSDPQLIDDASVTEPTPCAAKIALHAGDTTTTIAHVTQAVLTFTREAKTAVNSGTSSGDGKCLTMRHPGAAIDWTLALTTEDGNEVAALASGLVVNVRAFTNATEFWDLKWGIIGRRTGLQVDVETGNIISQVHNIAMDGFSAGAAGNITKPGAGSAWWPAA
jgi:hypothetical protein